MSVTELVARARHVAGSGPTWRVDTLLRELADALETQAAKVVELGRTRADSERYLADDGDGERAEFGTLAEAHQWADECVTAYRLAAMSDGEWPGEVNDVAVWAVVESTREFDACEGSDFVLESCTPVQGQRVN